MEERCPCCGNHCPKENLQCGRGKRYFESGISGGEHPENSGMRHGGVAGHGAPEGEDKVITLLRRCGHTLHHGGDGEKMISNLTKEEKEQLIALLEKLLG